MKKQSDTTEFVLSPEAIDRCSEKIRSFLTSVKTEKRDLNRYVLSVEEILLKHLDITDGNQMLILNMGVRFFKPFISVTITGKPYNTSADTENDAGIFGNSMLKTLGLSPEYSYSNGANIYTFSVKKKVINPFIKFGLAIIASLLIGFLGLLVLPNSFLSTVNNSVLTPIHDVFLNILGCIAGPMIFLSVAWGIYGIGDAATLKRVGKNMLLTYIGTVFIIILLCTALFVPAFNLNYTGGNEKVSGITQIVNMIFDIVPKNIFSPFVDGNTLQIIFLAVVIGIAMLFLGTKTGSVAKAVEQINYIVQFLIEFISKLVPFFIFIVILKMIWSDTFKTVYSVGKFFIVYISALLLAALCLILYTAIRNRVNPLLIVKKGLPTFLVALTTASSAAAFGTNITACKKSYGIDDKITSFGIPLGMTTFKPSVAVSLLALSLFFAECYNIKISAVWIATMIFSVVMLSIAVPPIPGGALATYTVLLAQLGLPSEALAIALTCDVLVDFIATGFDQFLLPISLINQSARLGMLDKSILAKK